MLSKVEPSGIALLDSKGCPHMVHHLVVTEKGQKVISCAQDSATLKIQVDNLFAAVAASGEWTESLTEQAGRLGIPQVYVEEKFTATWPDQWFVVIHGDLSVANPSLTKPVLAQVPVSLALGASWQHHKEPPDNFAAWMAKKDKATVDYESLNYSQSWLFNGFLMTRAGEGKNRVELYRNQGQPNILTQLHIQDCAPPEYMVLKQSLWGGLWIVERKHKYRRTRLNPLLNEISHGKYLLLWPEYSLPILEAYGVKRSKLPFFCLRPHQLRIKVLRALGRKAFPA